jgi:hydroxyacylglutathione hydrolase
VYGPASIGVVTDGVVAGDTVVLFDNTETYSVLATPGHTLDHIVYQGAESLFCGDTLFSGGCGRLFEGDAEMMARSFQQFHAMPDDTNIYCAHEYTSGNLQFAMSVEPNNEVLASYASHILALRQAGKITLPSQIGLEKKINPFMRLDKQSIKEVATKQLSRPPFNAAEVFSVLREMKNEF